MRLVILPIFAVVAQAQSYRSGQILWRPVQPGEVTLFGALGDLGKSMQNDSLLASRGVQRSVTFQYKSLFYEKNFFNVYKGVHLFSLWDGRIDMDALNHRTNRSFFGPSSPMHRSGHYELQLRWNLRDR